MPNHSGLYTKHIYWWMLEKYTYEAHCKENKHGDRSNSKQISPAECWHDKYWHEHNQARSNRPE